MADEVVPTNVAPVDDHPKRKLEDMELNAESEPLAAADSTANSDLDTLNNATEEEENGATDESEAKRARLESNDYNSNETHNIASTQNGNLKDSEDDNKPREEEAGVAEDDHKPRDEEAGVAEDDYKPRDEEAGEPEATDNNESSQSGQELAGGALEVAASDQLASDKNDNVQTASAQEQDQSEEEVKEPSDEVPKKDDVPVTELQQSGSDRQILTHKMEVPSNKVGVIIGKAGDTIRSLQDNTGAKIQIVRDADADPQSETRPLELIGTLESIKKAEKLIKDVIAEADAGGSPSLVARGFSTVQAAGGGEQLEIQVPLEKVGLIIGKGGETIRNLQTRSGARIQLLQQNLPEGEKPRKRTVRVTGNKNQIETATEMIKEAMNQTMRHSPLSSGYNQQLFHPRGSVASQWGPRGPHHAQFSGYDYPQRGPFPSQNSLYPPAAYGQYPPQQPPRNNYPSWEQRPPATVQGPSTQGNYGQPTPYSQTPTQHYGHPAYSDHTSSQQYGHMGSQPTPYAQTGTHSGYGSYDQYSKPPPTSYDQVPHSQPYGQPRPNQTGEVPYQGPTGAGQPYGQTVPPQQPHPYMSTAPPQTYAPYGSDGYSHPPSQGGQPVAGYSQPSGPTGGYGSYPSAQPSHNEQSTASNGAYGYQAQTDPGYGTQGLAGYGASATGQLGYAQPAPAQPGYNVPQSGGYQ